jgi:hypothetical protein
LGPIKNVQICKKLVIIIAFPAVYTHKNEHLSIKYQSVSKNHKS